jgi:hypothetical protein
MLNRIFHYQFSDYFAYLCPIVIVRRNCSTPLRHCCKGLLGGLKGAPVLVLETGLTMKKFILAAAICVFFAACGGDDGLTPTPQKPPTQGETTEVKAADIVKYFNLDKQLNVYQAIEKAKADLGKKTIDGKEMEVKAVNEVKRDDQKGTFTLKVTGVVGNKPFGMEVDFSGFAQKPADQDMAMRAVAKWKDGVDYLAEFDFDTLFRLEKTDKFTADYLSKLVDLSASAADGSNHYTFTPDDWAKTTISDVRYVPGNSHSGHVMFTITYNGIKGKTGNNASPSLAIDKNAYYAKQFTVDTQAASKFYMRGVYRQLDVFYGSLIKYDETKFAPLLASKQKNDGDNSIALTIKLTPKDGSETELAQFTLTLKGFKPLSDLNNEWNIAGKTEVNEFFGKKFRNTPDGDKTAQVKAIDTRAWLKLVQMTVKRGGNFVSLYPNEVASENGNYKVTAWFPSSSDAEHKDIYLEEPRIEVTAAEKKGNFLYIKYRLTSVNETAVAGVEKRTEVHLIMP